MTKGGRKMGKTVEKAVNGAAPTAEHAKSLDYPLLSKIKSPADLKAMDESEMDALCAEIRHVLVDTVGKNGGHLASNLGVVELTVAMHRAFDCPHDHFVFDVGHQSYVHKLLTGRFEQFHTLRRGGGISGFTKRTESEYDCFGAGHSSTSISASLGLAHADKLSGSDAYTVCVLGDGAFTGGMVHEALNNISRDLRLIIIMNENEMSISKNIGSFAGNIARIRRTAGYFKTKKTTVRIIKKIPLIGNWLFRKLRDTKKAMKNIMYGSNYFEDMGLYYLGPVDGNDYESVAQLLQEAKKLNESSIIHIKTQKGKGYAPAEENPGAYHGMSPSDACKPDGGNFSCHAGDILCDIAKTNEKLCAITAAMEEGTGLSAFKDKYPERFFDVGIAEEHAITFAAGLAAEGYMPVTAIYSTFMQRAYDQVIHDIALQELHVVMCIDRAGLNPGDGATHHGIFDVAFLSQIPHVSILTPVTYEGLRLSIETAVEGSGAYAIRYPSVYEDKRIIETFYPDGTPTEISVRSNMQNSEHYDATVILHGRIAAEALRAADILAAEGIILRILLAEYIKPYSKLAAEILKRLDGPAAPVLFVEEEIKAGGFGMMLSEELRKFPKFEAYRTTILAPEDDFVIQTRDEHIWKTAGVDADSIATAVKRAIRQ